MAKRAAPFAYDASPEARGQRLHCIRLVLEKSGGAMAQLLGISAPSYSKLEAGRATVKVSNVEPLLAYGFTTDFVYFGSMRGLDRETIRKLEGAARSKEVSLAVKRSSLAS